MKNQIILLLICFFTSAVAISCDNPVINKPEINKKPLDENMQENPAVAEDKEKSQKITLDEPEIKENSVENETVENKTEEEFMPDPKYGKEIFNNTCASCHGTSGAGDGVASAGLNPNPRDLRNSEYISELSDEHLFRAISEGGPAVGLSALMPPWKGILTRQQIRDVISHIRTNICKCKSRSDPEQ